MSNERSETTISERDRCLGIIATHTAGHRIALRNRKLSDLDRARHEQALATLETVAERIEDP